MSALVTVLSLDDCLDALIDYRGKTPVKTDSGIPLITAKIIKGGRIETPTEFIAKDDYVAWMRRGIPQEGDVVLTVEAPLGEVAQLGPEKIALAQRVVTLRGKAGLLDSTYLLYLLQTEEMQSQLKSRATGTTVLGIKQSELRKVTLSLPPFDLQLSAAATLQSLDDRITLLRETNATLEAIAQALFKSWFVDFDPVRAKMEGRAPEGMDEATAALFPDALEESELGWVPKGWQAAKIYEVSKVIYGAPFASKLFKAERPGRPLVRIRDLKDERPGVYTEEAHPKGYLLKPGDIAVGMDGEFRAYLWGGEEAWLNQRVCVFQPINGASAAFVRCSIAPLLAAVEASETATTVIHLGKNDIDRFKVVVPAPDILAAFTAVTVPLYSRLVVGKQQAQTLATLRDTLLPRLISGQLRLPEAQALVAAA